MTRAISVLAVLISTSALSYGTIVTYSDRATWEANVQSESTTDFDTAIGSYTPPSLNSYRNLGTGAFTINGIQFSSFVDSTPWTQYLNNYTTGLSNWNSGTILKADTSLSGHTSTFHIVLPTGTKAFGVDLMLINIAGSYSVKLDGVSTGAVGTFLNPTRSFFGVTSDNAIGVVDIVTTAGNVNPALDNLSLATPGAAPSDTGTATPEIHSFLLCATGLLTLSQLKKRFVL